MQNYISTPLYTTFENNIHQYDASDYAWRNLIHDHHFAIRERSTKVVVTPEQINAHLHTPDEYLRDIHSMDPGLEWIFLFINNIPSRMSFNWDITEVYLPNADFIALLYDSYRSGVAARKKNL